jgi:hypothetical protein
VTAIAHAVIVVFRHGTSSHECSFKYSKLETLKRHALDLN